MPDTVTIQTEAPAHTMRRWYGLGAGGVASPVLLYHATQAGPEARRAYVAGIMARMVGICLYGRTP